MSRSVPNKLRIHNPASFMAILLATLLLQGCGLSSFTEDAIAGTNVTLPPPAHIWADRIIKPGLPNLHRLSDELYRGAQPTAEGFRQLQAMGVKTVINLRFFFNDRKALVGKDLAYEEIWMNAWHAEGEDVIRFLQLISDHDRAPFFIHCNHGADRAGMLSAVYRIVVQGWSKDEAIAEMTQGGFNFHPIWQNLIGYLQNLDVEKLKQQAYRERSQDKIESQSEI